MHRCLQLAVEGGGHTAPNPMVAAVLVHGDRIIGEGYHQQFGGPHAEVNCINSVAENDQPFIAASTLYVSLEPCSHFGKTAPCTDLIIAKGIPEVVIACKDIYSEVNGSGIEKLKNAGIKVSLGVLEDHAVELNKRFFTFHLYQRPYIILKWAQSQNGKIDAYTGNTGLPPQNSRLRISNAITNRLVHQWRTAESAILVGTHTALRDDPALTARHWTGKNPIRLVIDNQLILPPSLQLFDGKAETIVFNQLKQETGDLVSYEKLNTETRFIKQLLNSLYRRRILSVLVEGGASLLRSFIDEGLWDEARVISNTQLVIEQGTNAPCLRNELLAGEETLLNDRIVYYTHQNSRIKRRTTDGG